MPRPPAVGPRLLLALGVGAAALLLPLWVATLVFFGAAVPLLRAGSTETRAALGIVLALTVGTVVLTPAWLHLLAGVGLGLAWRTALALALRLGAVLAVGLALGVVLRPIAWLTATRRFPRLGLALALTFRQVPELTAEVARVRRAQRARGLTVGARALRPVAVAVPVVVRALERAGRMGEALVLAGWTAEVPAAPVVRSARSMRDVLWAALGLGLLLLALWAFINRA